MKINNEEGVGAMAKEGGLGVGGVQTEEVQEEKVRFLALAPGGFKAAAEDAVVFEALERTRALDEAALQDDWAQTAFGLVVGGRHVGMLLALDWGRSVLLRGGRAFA